MFPSMLDAYKAQMAHTLRAQNLRYPNIYPSPWAPGQWQIRVDGNLFIFVYLIIANPIRVPRVMALGHSAPPAQRCYFAQPLVF